MPARTLPRFAKPALLLAVPAIALGACKSAGEQVSAKIAPEVKKALNADVTVTCPKDAKAKKGEKFSCDAKTVDGGQVLPISVEFTDDRKFTFTQGAAFDSTEKIETAMQQVLPSLVDGTVENIKCGDQKFIITKPGESFTCTFTLDGAEKTVTVPIKDVQGSPDTDNISIR